MQIRRDITGERFGKLTVLGFDKPSTGGDSWWRVRCECGCEKLLRRTTLARAVSCGCVRRHVLSLKR
jgi:hypothetical protein